MDLGSTRAHLNAVHQKQNLLLEEMKIVRKQSLKSSLTSYECKEYKDRFILVGLQELENISTKLDTLLTGSVPKIINELIDMLFEEVLAGYSQNRLKENQEKIFFCNNIILNFLNIVQTLQNKGLQMVDPMLATARIFDTVDRSILNKIKLLIAQYFPAAVTNEQEANTQVINNLKALLEKYNAAEIQEKLEQFKKEKAIGLQRISILNTLKYEFNLSEADQQIHLMWQIKTFINKIIEESNTSFQYFKYFMQKIFSSGGIAEQHYKIGSKLGKNTKKINQKQFTIRIEDQTVLRVVVKWNQELQKIVKTLSSIQQLKKNKNIFFTKEGLPFNFETASLTHISQIFVKYKSQYGTFENNSTDILGYILKSIENNRRNYPQISEEYIRIGQTSDIATKLVCDKAISLLIYHLKLLLGFNRHVRNNHNKELFNKDGIHISQFNFVEFMVGDLFRCKCEGTIQEIMAVFKELYSSTKIIRIRNRFNTGNMDLFINYIIKDLPLIFQIQLVLKVKQKSKKEKFIDEFIHFMYELRRSEYGPFIQAGFANSNYSDIVKYFRNPIKIERIGLNPCEILLNGSKVIARVDEDTREITIDDFSAVLNTFTYICANCLTFKNSYESKFKVFVHKSKRIKYCGICILNSLNQQQRRRALLSPSLFKLFSQIIPSQLQPQPQYIVTAYPFDYSMQPIGQLQLHGLYIQKFSTTKFISFNKIKDMNQEQDFNLASQLICAKIEQLKKIQLEQPEKFVEICIYGSHQNNLTFYIVVDISFQASKKQEQLLRFDDIIQKKACNQIILQNLFINQKI